MDGEVNCQTGRMEEYVRLSDKIANDDRFAGEPYSWGDKLIAQCARGEIEPGAQAMWRGAGTSRPTSRTVASARWRNFRQCLKRLVGILAVARDPSAVRAHRTSALTWLSLARDCNSCHIHPRPRDQRLTPRPNGHALLARRPSRGGGQGSRQCQRQNAIAGGHGQLRATPLHQVSTGCGQAPTIQAAGDRQVTLGRDKPMHLVEHRCVRRPRSWEIVRGCRGVSSTRSLPSRDQERPRLLVGSRSGAKIPQRSSAGGSGLARICDRTRSRVSASETWAHCIGIRLPVREWVPRARDGTSGAPLYWHSFAISGRVVLGPCPDQLPRPTPPTRRRPPRPTHRTPTARGPGGPAGRARCARRGRGRAAGCGAPRRRSGWARHRCRSRCPGRWAGG